MVVVASIVPRPRREMASRGRRPGAGPSGTDRRAPGRPRVDLAGGGEVGKELATGPRGSAGPPSSCQGSRQSASPSNSLSSRFSTQRPRPSSSLRQPFRRSPSRVPAAVVARLPGRPPATPLTTSRPRLIKRSKRWSSWSADRPCMASAYWRQDRLRCRNQRSRPSPSRAMVSPPHSRLQRKVAIPVIRCGPVNQVRASGGMALKHQQTTGIPAATMKALAAAAAGQPLASLAIGHR